MNVLTSVSIETTWHVKDTCLCLHTQRAARVLARRFDEALRPAGLTNEQFSLMNAMNAPTPVAMGRVASLLGADRTTLTAALKPLTRRGMAVVSPDPNDRRVRRVALTADGQACLARAMPLWTLAHGRLEAELSATDPDRLRQDLVSLSSPRPDAPAADAPER